MEVDMALDGVAVAVNAEGGEPAGAEAETTDDLVAEAMGITTGDGGDDDGDGEEWDDVEGQDDDDWEDA